MGISYNRLARVWFDDDRVNQCAEGGSYTGYDTLIIACQYANDLLLTLFVDCGVKGIRIASAFQSDRSTIFFNERYDRASFEVKLSHQQIDQLFGYVFDNPQLIAPINSTIS